MQDLASEIIRKQFGIIILLILCLVVSNGIWVWYINQFDFRSDTVEQDIDSNSNSTITQQGITG